jgi:EmrB/QacA subfamily drug resistance transporter
MVVDATIVQVALVSIGSDLGADLSRLQWVITAYVLAFGGLLILGGQIADHFGRRRAFTAGAAVFAMTSALAAIAPSLPMLVVGRAGQGLAAAVMAPAALALLLDCFPDGRSRQRALGVWATVGSLGAAIGLIAGGVLAELISWRWIFWTSGIAAALVMIASLSLPCAGRQRRAGAMDPIALAATTLALTALVGLLSEGPRSGASPITWALLAVSALSGTVVGVRLWRHRNLEKRVLSEISLRANVTVLLLGASLYALFFVATLAMGNALGYGPLRTGLTFLPFAGAVAIGVRLCARLRQTLATNAMTAVGLLVTALGLFPLALGSLGTTHIGALLLSLIGGGLGLGICMVPLTEMAVAGVDAHRTGTASALFNTAQQMGGALAVAAIAGVESIVNSGIALALAGLTTLLIAAAIRYAWITANEVRCEPR